MAMFDGLTNALSGAAQSFSSYMKKNPEQMAIVFDQLGKNIAPNNAFAGIGTGMAQSNLAADAAKQQQDERQGTIEALVTALGGGGQVAPAQPQEQGMTMGAPKLTPGNLPGPTQIVEKANPDGTISKTTLETIQTPQQQQQPQGVNLSEWLPLALALSDTPQANLRGLTPEQILGISRNDLALGDLQRSSVGTLQRALTNQAIASATAARVPAQNRADDALTLQRLATAEKTATDRLQVIQGMLQSEELHPLEKTKLVNEGNKLLQDIEQSRALTGKYGAETTGQVLDNQEAQRTAEALAAMTDTGTNLNEMNAGALVTALGPGAAQDFITSQGSQGETQLQNVLKSASIAQNDDEPMSARITSAQDWNTRAPDNSTYGFLYDDGTGIFNAEEVETVVLPDGITMGDVRVLAKQRGMTVEQVLSAIAEGE